MIAGTKSGVGKTTISMGLMSALSKKMNVQPYKVGPDYIDSAFHSYITGNNCSNLDSYLLKEPMINYLFNKNKQNKDIAVVEGVMGLFDGAEVGSDIGTSASIAKLLDIPVILVVDGSKVASSIAATVKGFETFDNDLKISGVIINNVGSRTHYKLLKSAIEYHTNVIPCGYLVKNSSVTLPERHLGLVPACEQQDIDKIFSLLAEQIEETIDLDAVMSIASQPEIIREIQPINIKNSEDIKGVRIAIARDKAFNFYYQDSLDLLSDYYNVSWIPYSPLTDKKLPEDIDGLYIGGGFPEVFTKEIANNESMKKDLINRLRGGLPYIAECGGLIYLSDSLIDLEGKKHPMIGWLEGETVMTTRLQRFGYGFLTLEDDCILGKKGDSINIHEFHRSKADIKNQTIYRLKKIRNKETINEWECGFNKSNGIAAYAHIHFGSNMNFGKAFVDRCNEFKRRG